MRNWSRFQATSAPGVRELPHFGDFDLVLSLNDSVNYLLGEDDLVLALAGMRANLADEGLLVFDVNSRSTYAEIAGDRLVEPIRHLERFRSESEVLEAMRAADLQPVAALGMSEANGEVLLTAPLDEDRDYKLVFIGAPSRRFCPAAQ